MNISTLKNMATSKVALTVLKGKQHSPTIMFGAGVVGVVATVVMASKATLKLDEILEETDVNLSNAKSLHASGRDDYSDEVYKKDVAIIHVKSAVQIAKLYGPAFVVGVASIGALTGAHVTLNRRNASLVAAYAAVDKAFKEYRARVLEEVGPEKERELRHGVTTREIFSEGENGEPLVKTVKEPSGASMYAKFFDETNQNFEPSGEHNIFFLKAQQNYLNDQLKRRGYVLLNDAYDALGMDRTPAGCVVGWLYGSDGDNYIDFGIWGDKDMQRFHDFVVGRESAILLDFNVDGVIYKQI